MQLFPLNEILKFLLMGFELEGALLHLLDCVLELTYPRLVL